MSISTNRKFDKLAYVLFAEKFKHNECLYIETLKIKHTVIAVDALVQSSCFTQWTKTVQQCKVLHHKTGFHAGKDEMSW